MVPSRRKGGGDAGGPVGGEADVARSLAGGVREADGARASIVGVGVGVGVGAALVVALARTGAAGCPVGADSRVAVTAGAGGAAGGQTWLKMTEGGRTPNPEAYVHPSRSPSPTV